MTSSIGAAAADDAVVIELLVALADQVAVLGAQPLVLERAPHDDQQLVDLERLLQVVERAELHRLDRALDRGVRGHHQDLRPLAFGRRRRRTRGSDRGRSAPASRCRRPARRTSARRAAAAPRAGWWSRRPRGRRRAAPGRAPSGSFLRRRRAESSRGASSAMVERSPRVGRRCGVDGKLDRDFGAAPGVLATVNRAAESFDDVLGDRQAEAGAAALGREVGIEDLRQIRRRRCRRRDRRSIVTRDRAASGDTAP